MQDKDSVKWSAEDNEYVGHFAMTVFTKADKQDMSGRANLDTAKAFYAASLFIEILHVFGELQFDFQQKQKYAAWRAAEIWKSLNRKRKSVPHSVITNEDETSDHKISVGGRSPEDKSDVQVSEMLEATGRSIDIPSSIEYPSRDDIASSLISHHQSNGETDPSNHASDRKTVTFVSHFRQERDADSDHNEYDGIKQSDEDDDSDKTTHVGNPSYHPSTAVVAEAHKVAKMAVSSLAFDDVPSAISFLKEALDLLTIP